MGAESDIDNSGEIRSSKLKTFLIEAGIVLILVVVTLVELQYFKIVDLRTFFPVKSSFQSQQASQKSVPAQVNAPTPTLSPRVQAMKEVQNNLDMIAKNNALRIAVFVIEFDGKIISIDTAGELNKRTPRYKIRLIVSVGEGEDTTTVLYPEQSISRIKIADTKKNSLNFSDLKPGDRVTIKRTLGIRALYPNNLVESTITKLN